MAALDRLQADDIELQRLVMAVFHLARPLSALHEEPLRSADFGRRLPLQDEPALTEGGETRCLAVVKPTLDR
jgi:hypothetical protein